MVFNSTNPRGVGKTVGMASLIAKRFTRLFGLSDRFCRRHISRCMSSVHEVETKESFRTSGESPDTTSPDAPPPTPPPEEDQRLLKAAVIGTPNVGKSTLVNQLLGAKLFAVSPKVHTTVRKAMGVFTEGNAQVVLLDTPGVVPYRYGRKLHLPKQFLTDPARSLMEADLIMVIVDTSNKRTREQIHPDILASLRQNSHIPSLLILNKVDAVKQKHLLLFTAEALTGSLETQSKKRQIKALRGKLRDGTIRGKRARLAAQEEIEQLLDELRIINQNEKEEEVGSIAERVFSNTEGDKTECDGEAPFVEGGLGGSLKSTSSLAPVSPSSLPSQLSGVSPVEVESSLSATQNGVPPTSDVDQPLIESNLSSGAKPAKKVITSWPNFGRIFMVSALTGDGVNDLKDHLLSCAKPRSWEYLSSDITDLPSLTLVEDIIREKLFHHYDLELPYITKQENVIWEWSDDGSELTIYQNLICQKPSQASILIGPRGSSIQSVIAEAREDIEKLLKCTVDLTIYVKTAKKK